MSEAKYAIGIDLGTSNCALAFARLGEQKPRDFAIRQISRPGEVSELSLLPSFLYSPLPEEKESLAASLDEGGEWITGVYARWRGARVPGRLISSAKSWLCHPFVDRTAAILPYGGAEDVRKISPVAASAKILRRLRLAWNEAHPQEPMEGQEVVITIPASFDEAARSLTVQAVKESGLEKFTLLEEPQAAFYHFTSGQGKRLAQALEGIRLVLVADVGGGTSDFTLVQVDPDAEQPRLRRIAVGDHLILGGDNMDNALARAIEAKLGGRKLSTGQWVQLVQAAREAKEFLLAPGGHPETRVSFASEGSQLLGKTISLSITRAEVEGAILDGFFPKVGSEGASGKTGRGGIQEMGLPYAADPAITRHIAAFLQKHARSAFEALNIPGAGGLPRPDAILLNGGVFNATPLRDRLVEVVSSWWPDAPEIPALSHGDLDHAVARGAAAYGLVRRGIGQRISGGTAHAFYLGIAEKEGEPARAICIIPRGLEECATVELKDHLFKLHLGKPVQFPLYTSTADRLDRAGDLVTVNEELAPLPPIHSLLKTNKPHGEKVPVFLEARLTEIGTVEVWCVSPESRERWRLEFELRGRESSEEVAVTASLPPGFEQAREAVQRVYGPKTSAERDAKQLWGQLERALGSRDSWNLPTLRQLAGDLIAAGGRRRRSAAHERVFFQALGYCLRPGFGYPLDAWRAEQSFKLFTESVQFQKEKPNWNEFWILWRRIGGGLGPERQGEMWNYLKPHLGLRVPPHAPKSAQRPKGIQPEGIEEMVRAAATLEEIPAAEKFWFGNLLLERIESGASGGPWIWSLGRVGARAPLYGSVHNCVDREEVESWIQRLLTVGLGRIDGATFAVAEMARLTGDRQRDINDSLRKEVVDAMKTANAPEHWIKMVSELSALKAQDEARVFGDSLPIGLQLVRN